VLQSAGKGRGKPLEVEDLVAHRVLKEVDELAGERPHRHWAQPSEVNGPYLERGKEVRRASGVGVPTPVGVSGSVGGSEDQGLEGMRWQLALPEAEEKGPQR
jgi:hypothetical protein